MAAGTDLMTHSGLILHPDPARTVLRPFTPEDPAGFATSGHPRAERIARRLMEMDVDLRHQQFARLAEMLGERHRGLDAVLDARFEAIAGLVPAAIAGDEELRRVVAGYLLEEYSFEAAALFNPSIVPHPDQDGAPPGGVRFVLSLRGIGEGHLSSITFRTGCWSAAAGFVIDPPSGNAATPRITAQEREADGACTRIDCTGSREVSETVLFPVTEAQRQGIEDLRMCRFEDDDGSIRNLGTYTAFSGAEARCELLEADSFRTFVMREITGNAAASKGIALFPRRVDGRYAALSRHDNENLWLVFSDSLTHWEGGTRILTPKHFWEFVQIGNCGSPIAIEEGWLVLTHGVGEVRNYCIGACLLDRDDPSKVLGRLSLPLVHPSPKERDGYVPNVVYSCGGMVHDRTLLLPYGVADGFTTFAHVALDDLLAAME